MRRRGLTSMTSTKTCDEELTAQRRASVCQSAADCGGPLARQVHPARGRPAMMPGMANIEIDQVDGLSARAVMHAQTSALDQRTTIGQARAYFSQSTSRRLAIIAQDGRYLAALTPGDLPSEGDQSRPALEVAPSRPIVAPHASAAAARDLALATDARRVPVVGDDGRFLGIVSVNSGLRWFCGTG